MNTAEDEVSVEAALAYYFECFDRGESIEESGLIAKFPQRATELLAFFADQRQLHARLCKLSSKTGDVNRLTIRCPHCHQPNEVAIDSRLTNLTCSTCGSRFSLVDPAATAADAPAAMQLGRFHLIERLGMGSFGTVWKARDESLDRTVAVKVPRRGGMTPSEQEKFFREARAAAQLRHPNIVSVHEVGRDRDSVYIVSDFVRGVTLAEWLAEQRPTCREAAELCAKIADALEHAHQMGVVHRDLKPANIMIDEDGKPHLMDFGLARREVGEVTMTLDGYVLGTPAYMSPEQADGKAHAADRRSDIYSLGAILFQLLTGELPFRGNSRMIMHQVVHDEPPSPRKLNGRVPKDLETITLKCLEKDAARRYPLAADLAAELRRYLAREPIKARPIGALERSARWVRRNKVVAALSAAIIAALLLGTVVSTIFAFDARKQARLAGDRAHEAVRAKQQTETARAAAVSRQNEAQAVTNVLVGAFKSPNPNLDGRKVTVAEILDRAEKNVDDELSDQPLVQAALLHAIGESRQGLGLWREAVEPLTKARKQREELLGTEHEDTLQTKFTLAGVLMGLNHRLTAQHLYEQVLESRRNSIGSDHLLTIKTMDALAYAYRLNGRPQEAIELMKEVVALRKKALGESDPSTLAAMSNLGNAYSRAGMYDEAIKIQEEAVAEIRKHNSRNYFVRASLASTYCGAGHYDKAIELYGETIEIQRDVLGDGHPDTLNSINVLASSHLKANQPEQAIPLFEEALRGRREALGEDHLETILVKSNLAKTFRAVDRIEDAIVLYEQAFASARKTFGPGTQNTRWPLDALVAIYPDKERVEKGIATYATMAVDTETKYGARHPFTIDTKLSLARIYQKFGRFKDAIDLFEQLLETGEKNAIVLNALALALVTSTDESVRDGKRAVAFAQAACEMTEYKNAVHLKTLAAAYAETGNFEEALQCAERGLELVGEKGQAELRTQLLAAIDQYKAGTPTRSSDNATASNMEPRLKADAAK